MVNFTEVNKILWLQYKSYNYEVRKNAPALRVPARSGQYQESFHGNPILPPRLGTVNWFAPISWAFSNLSFQNLLSFTIYPLCQWQITEC